MIFKWTVTKKNSMIISKRKADIRNPKDHKKAQPKLSKMNRGAKPSKKNLINSRRVTQVAAKEKHPQQPRRNSAAAWRGEGRSQRAA
jgi:hypothetical protein